MPSLDLKLVQHATVESLAMAFFVYFGTGSALSTGEMAVNNDVPDLNSVARVLPIAMAFGFTITVLVFAFGHISGGHINPAVTLLLTLIGECEPIRAAYYIVGQLVGSVIGSLLLWGSTHPLTDSHSGGNEVGSPPFALGANRLNPNLTAGNGLILEGMGTLLLCVTVTLTVLHRSGLAHGGDRPQLAPLPIGFAVMVAHIVLVPFTGCGINPARTFGPAVVNSFAGNDVWGPHGWIYYVGPVLGAIVAAGLHKTVLAPAIEANKTPDSPDPNTAQSKKVEHQETDALHKV